MASVKNHEDKIKSCLEVIFKSENFQNFEVTKLENAAKGSSCTGDTFYLTVIGTKEDKSVKKHNLVLKLSKASTILRKNVPVQEMFFNEILCYEKILPRFNQFQKEKHVKDPFNSTPKCFGTYTDDNLELIVLEDLNTYGYELWPKKEPWKRQYVELVMKEIGKYHATSVAFQNHNREEFDKFVGEINDIHSKFNEIWGFKALLERVVDDSVELLQNDLNAETLQKWKQVKGKIKYIVEELTETSTDPTVFKVILHGDCWNNNFMHLHKEGKEKVPLKVAILDWQVPRYTSPIVDLSILLLSSMSEDDFHDIDEFLKIYYNSFVQHLIALGVNGNIYSRQQFLKDWDKYSLYGIMKASLLMKIVSTEKDEIRDIGEHADSGKRFSESFVNDIRDKENYKKRLRPIIKYAVGNNPTFTNM